MSFYGRLIEAGWDPLSAGLFQELVERVPDGVAVFDADGTLWDGDCGEAFFRSLIQQGHVKSSSEEELIQAYQDHCARNVTEGYGWVVQQMAGLTVEKATVCADSLMASFVESMGFTPMIALVKELEKTGWSCWIVSASAGVVVRAGAKALGLSSERVLGVELGVEHGCFTEELVQLPNLEGKVKAMDRAGLQPGLAAGNSVNDIPMLKQSSGLALCINPSGELYEMALEQKWTCVSMGENP